MKRVGVLALQGAVSEHIAMLERCGAAGVPVRHQDDLRDLSALILPGGESTAISRLVRQRGLYEPLRAFGRERPVMGTCAGMILCAREIAAQKITAGEHVRGDNPEPLGLIDITVSRNGFGRQVDSFEAPLAVRGVGDDVPGVFIRAPYIERVGDGVTVMATVRDRIVMAACGTVLVAAFHPELADDTRVMEYFLQKLH